MSINNWRCYLHPNDDYFCLPSTVVEVALAVIDDYHERIEGLPRINPELAKNRERAVRVYTTIRPLLKPGRVVLAREDGHKPGSGLEWRLAAIL